MKDEKQDSPEGLDIYEPSDCVGMMSKVSFFELSFAYRYYVKLQTYRDALRRATEAEGRVRELEATVVEARGIIEQYPPMVRNILRNKPVRNVCELEGQAKQWIEANHE